ncbi:hypothetical protein NY607_12260 [Lysinibacillus sp. A4]|uniref:hypothetical protein n=1 Tax=Lysinibacillus sp. A4 TaxID=2976269 RepID=UPI002175DB18|nr:hypothetical protein [Lysinibacillus sp. A4]MCS5501899.1 hypothetical protein [Lysinibacillus sp. A4]
MLGELQTAYGQALKNLVFVDFVNKKVIGTGGLNALEMEHSKESACCRDMITAINLHFHEGDFDLVKERIEVLTDRVNYIKSLEGYLKEQRCNKLFEIASHLCKQGKLAKVVRRDVNPNC